jgi:glycosyltransferase involved in cell wall biosynthesis
MPQPRATPQNVGALIPAYQEARHIRDVATRTKAVLQTVLVVDDGSTDGTWEQARVTGVAVTRHEKNQGKGAAIKTGMRELLGRDDVQFMLVLDGDGQHLPEEIPHFLEAANATGAALVVGSRMGDTRKMPFVRKCTNRYMSWTISQVIGQRVPDTQCGFRMFHRSLASELLKSETSAFDFETEMLAIAARLGCIIGEAGVSTVYGEEVSKIHAVRDTLKFFRLLRRLKREARAAKVHSSGSAV